MERVVKQLEKWEVQDTATIAKALDKIIQNIEKAAAKEGTKALARANAKERAEATVSKVDLPSFMEEARWGVLRLFQDHFLVGTVNGKAALQWLLQVLTPPAGHDFVQQWETRMGPFLGYVLFAYKQHYSEAEQATAADKLSLHAGNDFYTFRRSKWRSGELRQNWDALVCQPLQLVSHDLALLLFEKALHDVFIRLLLGSEDERVPWREPSPLQIDDPDQPGFVDEATASNLYYVFGWVFSAECKKRRLDRNHGERASADQAMLATASRYARVDPAATKHGPENAKFAAAGPTDTIKDRERHAGALWRITLVALKYSLWVEACVREWLSVARLQLFGRRVIAEVTARIVGHERSIQLFGDVFPKNLASILGTSEEDCKVLLDVLRATITERQVRSRGKYWTQELADKTTCRKRLVGVRGALAAEHSKDPRKKKEANAKKEAKA